MTLLQIMPEDDGSQVLLRTNDAARIEARLRSLGIGFERWSAAAALSADADKDEVLDAYKDEVGRLRAEGGYRLVDVVRISPDEADVQWPTKARAARENFLDEHTHDESEVRFFAEGRGCFYLHLGDIVCAVLCEAGDLLSVPAGTRHWFDMGKHPRFTAIRFFQAQDGWIANFTADPIAHRIPYLDELLAVRT